MKSETGGGKTAIRCLKLMFYANVDIGGYQNSLGCFTKISRKCQIFFFIFMHKKRLNFASEITRGTLCVIN